MVSADCDDCRPGRGMQASTAIIFSSLPFIATFLFVATIVLQKLLPILSGDGVLKGRDVLFPQRIVHTPPRRLTVQRLSAYAFSTTIALAAVLAELILCDISNTINPAARGVALHVTVVLLLFLLILAIPFLEIHSIISAAGWEYTGKGKGRLRLAWILHLTAFTAWLLGFWWSGEWLLGKRNQEQALESQQSLIQSSLERVGVIGISFMSLLSGFASVSSPWQNFGSRPKSVTEADIARKAAGLEATNDMLSVKRSRLHALERKMSDAPAEGYWQKAIGSFRGNADQTERKNLEFEVSGLETMAFDHATSHSLLKSRLRQQHHSRTPTGRLLLIASYIFSLFCLYRILTTTLTATRRFLFTPNHTNPTLTPSDPINNILALLAKHYDPHLNQASWARQISFLLSGIILLASFSSVMQTFHLFSRFFPTLLKSIQTNLPLIVAQVCATYVISAALMLRGLVPGQVAGEGLKGLGGGEMGWVDGWFEKWFLGGVVATGVGIWVGRKFGGEEEEDWGEDDVEMGKRS